MDSDDSDEEFLSADEGDDEVTVEVIQKVEAGGAEVTKKEDPAVQEQDEGDTNVDVVADSTEAVLQKEEKKEIVSVVKDSKDDLNSQDSKEEDAPENDDQVVGDIVEEAEVVVDEVEEEVVKDEVCGEAVSERGEKTTEEVAEADAEVEDHQPEGKAMQLHEDEPVPVSCGEPLESIVKDEAADSPTTVEETITVEEIMDVKSQPVDDDDKEEEEKCDEDPLASAASPEDKESDFTQEGVPVNEDDKVVMQEELDNLSIEEKTEIEITPENLAGNTCVAHDDNQAPLNQSHSDPIPDSSEPDTAVEDLPSAPSVIECVEPSDEPAVGSDVALQETDEQIHTSAKESVEDQNEPSSHSTNDSVSKDEESSNQCAEDCAEKDEWGGPEGAADESWDWVDNAETITAAQSDDVSRLEGENSTITAKQDLSGQRSPNRIPRKALNVKTGTTSGDGSSSMGNNMRTPEDSWGWDSWADNFISQASSKVSTLMETVEGQLGIPDPTIVAQKLKEEREKEVDERGGAGGAEKKEEGKQEECTKQENAASSSTSSWFSSYMPVASTLTNLVQNPVASTLTNLVQNKGQELMTGGIDALEYIGKSTVNYLSEGDPGLRNKRKEFLRRNKGETLSQVLEQAKIKADERQLSDAPPKGEDPKKLSDMLEKFQGIAHLDALQMLSTNCEAKLLRISKVQSDEARKECSALAIEIKQTFELTEPEEENPDSETDFKKDVFAANKTLKMKVTCSKLLNSWSKLKKKTENFGFDNSDECFESCISSLAEFVSRCVEYYRKVADMLIMTDIEAKEMAVKRAQVLKSLSEMFRSEASDMANSFANYLANNKEDKVASDFITDIYVENENCSSLLSDAHNLILPILQCSAIQ